MKPRYLVTTLLLSAFIPLIGTAQDTFDSEIYHNRLYHLGKVWGYTKYFHPSVANCTIDWDEELIAAVEKVRKSTSDESFNQILLEMLNSAGTIPKVNSTRTIFEDWQSYNLNTEWFDIPIFNDELKEKLLLLEENYRETINCKIKSGAAGNPNLGADNYLYTEENYFPNEGQRALAFFRYWNVINYFFPYKYQMDQDWDETLAQFIPAIIEAQNELDFVLAFKEMTTYINDSHGFFYNRKYAQWRGYNIAPFLVKMVEDQTVIVKVHESVKDKISVGDIIVRIDNEPVEVVRERIRKYMEGSNEPTINRNISSNLIVGEGGQFKVTVKNNSGEKEVELVRRRGNEYATLFGNLGTSYELKTTIDGCQVGYVDMELLTRAEVPEMFRTFQKLPAIIIDIRNYPQGTLWEMVNYLFDGPVNFSAFTIPHTRFPGILNFRQHSIGNGTGKQYKGKLIMLFNEDTQSQAEFTIMGLEQHPRALKIGSQTAGADGNISTIYLPGGISTVFTGLGVFYPDGRETQRIGIVPDIEFHPTIKGIREGRDEMLEFALDCELLELVRPEFSEGNGINVFPNPVIAQLNIQSQYSTNYSIQVTDILGRFIKEFNIAPFTPTYDINLSDLNQGIYLLTFIDRNGVFATEKVIKH